MEQDGYLYTVIGRGNYVTSGQEWKAGKTREVLQKVSELFSQARKTVSTGQSFKSFLISKGMKKQLSVLLGICSGASYLLCDETFDGLDSVMRQTVKQLFIEEIEDQKLTPVIASHSLRELEDICDHVGLLHKGGILFAKDLDEINWGYIR